MREKIANRRILSQWAYTVICWLQPNVLGGLLCAGLYSLIATNLPQARTSVLQLSAYYSNMPCQATLAAMRATFNWTTTDLLNMLNAPNLDRSTVRCFIILLVLLFILL